MKQLYTLILNFVIFVSCLFSALYAETSGTLNNVNNLLDEECDPPLAICQNYTVYLNASGTASITAADLDNGSTALCGLDTIILSKYNFTCADIGNVAVSFTVTDLNGNNSVCNAVVTVSDGLAPQLLSCPSDIVVNAINDNCHRNVSWIDPLFSDNCSYTVSSSHTSGQIFSVGVTTVTYTATDPSGNSTVCSFNITVIDNQNPIITGCPTNLTYNLPSGDCKRMIFWLGPVASDNCPGVAMTASHIPGDTLPAGTTTVTYTATDASGNSTSCSFDITVKDNQGPQITNCPVDQTVYLDGMACTKTVSWNEPTATDNCNPLTVTSNYASGDAFSAGFHTVNYTVTDVSGNTASCSFNITVLDTIKPIGISRNINAYLNAAGNVSISAGDVDNGSSDNCSLDTLLLSKYNFNCNNLGFNTITLTAVDNNGYTHSVPATVNVIDTISPIVNTHDISVYLNATGTATINVSDINNGSMDGCQLDTLYLSKYVYNCGDVGVNTVVLTAVDMHGNITNATAIVTVIDNLAPAISVNNVNLYLDATGNAILNIADVDNGTTDNCNLDTLYLNNVLFDCSNTGSNNVTLTATDIYGNTTTAIAPVNVIDTISPVAITQNLTVYLNSAGTASIASTDIDNGSSDACGIASSNLSKSVFTCAEIGNNAITFTVTDNNGNTSAALVNVMVVDTISPVAVAQDITVYLDAAGNFTISPSDVDNGSSDICSVISSSLDKNTFNCADVGVNPVTLTITDAQGNNSLAVANVTVVDSVSPQILTNPLTVYLNATGTVTITAMDLDNGTSDACGIASISISKSNFNCSETGINNITFTATDNNGNASAGSVTVTVLDTVSPGVLTRDVDLYLDASGTAVLTAADIDNGSNHTCGIAQMSISKNTFDCSDLGTNIIQLMVTDNSGNVSSANATVTVYDTISPQINIINITAWLNASGTLTVAASDVDNGSADACGIVSGTLSKNTFNCADVGVNTVTFNISDGSGNSASASVQITVLDTISPQLNTNSINLYLDATGSATISPADVDNGSTDACGISTRTLDVNTFNCNDVGQNTVVFTVTDIHGNSSSGSVNVNVLDTINPTLSTQNITVYLDASGQYNLTAAEVHAGSSDVCGINALTLDRYVLNCTDIGTTTVNLTVQDNSGNSTSASANIMVVDTIKPSLADQSVNLYLNTSGNAGISVSDLLIPGTDNCGIETIVFSKTSFNCPDIGSNVIQATATDKEGNSHIANITVNVIDSIQPQLSVNNINVYLDAGGNASISTADINNGSSDACGILSVSIDRNNFNCNDIGLNPVVITAVDLYGNTAYDTAVVNVMDTIIPTLQAFTTRYVYLDATGQVNVTPSVFNNGSSDNCSLTFSMGKGAYDCSDIGLNNEVFTVTDMQGNTASKNVLLYVLDTIKPQFNNMPDTVTVYNTIGQCSVIVNWPNITASDNCTGTIIGYSQQNGTYFSKGFTTVLVDASDPSGNMSYANFVVEVIDTMAPVISGLPTAFNITPDPTNCSATVSWSMATATDNCGIANFSSTHSPGDVFPVGTTTVTYTAIDNEGNSRSASFNVTVTDQIAPVITGVPANISKNASAGSCGAKVNFSLPLVTDNCPGTILTSSHSSGSTFPVGTTQVNFTATDASGNISTSNFKITVKDIQPPSVLYLPESDTVGLCNAAYVYSNPVGWDNCGATSVTRLTGPASGSILSLGNTQFSFRISDNSGNDTVVGFNVWVMEGSEAQLPLPIEVCENGQLQDLTNGQQSLVWAGKGVQNNRWFDPSVAGDGTHTLNYTFTDEFNCTDTGSFTVTVLPTPPTPVIEKIGSTTLAVSGKYSSYQWYRDGILIPGATSSVYNYIQAGNYQVIVGNGTECEAYGPGYIISSGAGGISLKEPDLNRMSIYPIPSTGNITIDLYTTSETELECRIFSLDGRLIFHEKMRSNVLGKIQIDLTHLPVASYLMQAVAEDQKIIKNIIIQY